MNMDLSRAEVLKEIINKVRTGEIVNTPNLILAKDGLEVPVGSITDVIIKETGLDTPIKIYAPEGEGPFPVVFFNHGGGFVFGDYSQDEAIAREMVNKVGCIVISIQYALAPEYPWPTAVNEIYDVIKWTIANAEKYKIDKDNLAIAGSSAGASLAAAICILAYDREEFSLKHAALIYPAVDLSGSTAKEENFKKEYAVLSPEAGKAFAALYLENDFSKASEPTVSVIYGDVNAFPPLSIFSAGEDYLSKSQRIFVNKLIDADKEVLHKIYPEVPHGFFEISGYESIARDCRETICAQLKAAFNKA